MFQHPSRRLDFVEWASEEESQVKGCCSEAHYQRSAFRERINKNGHSCEVINEGVGVDGETDAFSDSNLAMLRTRLAGGSHVY